MECNRQIMPEKLNKLQIRAMVFDIIKSYNYDADFESELHKENMRKLNSIEDKKFACEILLKELVLHEGFELDVIKYLIADFASLEMIENTIWEILYNPEIPDRQKEIYLQLLRAFGGKVDINELMNCMDDVESVVDEQTQGLLEIAAVNPEAQVDFLDFLMSLPAKEQILLLKSLSEDFKGDEMANMVTPCLRIDLEKEVKEEVLNIMRKIPSYLSVKPLKNFISSSGDEDLKKSALLTLNQIKASGIDIDNKEILNYREDTICKDSSFFKAFLSQVDGCGNQGLIFSRINSRNKIVMFSTVINVTDGIMDCFGLYDISENDFLKVVTRFKAHDYVIPITAEVAKYKLSQSEKKSSETNTHLPYEYFCWNVYTCDIEENPIDYDSLLVEKTNITSKELYTLYDTGVFDSWFFEYDDNIHVREYINYAITAGKNSDNPVTLVEEKTDDTYAKVFTNEKINEYVNMLRDSAFVFYMNDDFKSSNLCMNVANSILEGNTLFLKDVLKRSILQHLANIVAEGEEKHQTTIFDTKEDKPEITDKEAFKLMKLYESTWDSALYE